MCWRWHSPGSCPCCWSRDWLCCSRYASRFRQQPPWPMGVGWPSWPSVPSPPSRCSCSRLRCWCCRAASAWRCCLLRSCACTPTCTACSPILKVREPFWGLARKRGRATPAAPSHSNTDKESIMNITATSPGTGLQTRAAIERPHPLIRVMAWELRCFCASRLFWVQALGFFGLSLCLTWPKQIPLTLNHAHATVPFYGFEAGTSAWGLFLTLPTGTLMLLGMLLPFVNADGVTRDLSRRTHELLLATALPTWAYVWGRYLVGLLISLALSVLALAAILVMGLFLHLTITGHPLPEIANHIADYPLPQISNVMVIWIGMVASATVLVSSLSFALGTLLPRLTTLVKMVILLGWFVGAQVPSILFGDASHAANFSLPAWDIHWDPTSVGTAR